MKTLKFTGRELKKDGMNFMVFHDAGKSPLKENALAFFDSMTEADRYCELLNTIFKYKNEAGIYPRPRPTFRSRWIGEYGTYKLIVELDEILVDGKRVPSARQIL